MNSWIEYAVGSCDLDQHLLPDLWNLRCKIALAPARMRKRGKYMAHTYLLLIMLILNITIYGVMIE